MSRPVEAGQTEKPIQILASTLYFLELKTSNHPSRFHHNQNGQANGLVKRETHPSRMGFFVGRKGIDFFPQIL